MGRHQALLPSPLPLRECVAQVRVKVVRLVGVSTDVSASEAASTRIQCHRHHRHRQVADDVGETEEEEEAKAEEAEEAEEVARSLEVQVELAVVRCLG